jgi:hypothetical protein
VEAVLAVPLVPIVHPVPAPLSAAESGHILDRLNGLEKVLQLSSEP